MKRTDARSKTKPLRPGGGSSVEDLRPTEGQKAPATCEPRPLERIKFHYETEKALASRLMSASKEERRAINVAVHEELYKVVTDHPLLTRRDNPEAKRASVERQVKQLSRWLSRKSVFLELGAGDCVVSLKVAALVQRVYAVDIHEKLVPASTPSNFSHVLSDGVSVPVSQVTVAYSHQLMEHLHPDDASEQLANVHAALAPGGVYICNTPNRLTGPHDVSRPFDDVATGFHLHEYTIRELHRLFRRFFGKVRYLPMNNGVEIPIWIAVVYEWCFSLLPRRFRLRMRLPTVVVGYKL